MSTLTALSLAKPASDTGGDLQQKATGAFMSLHIVNAAAHALRNTALNPITAISSENSEVQALMVQVQTVLADLKSKLDHAHDNADVWINDLMTRVSQTVPNHILDYGATFDAASDQILALLAEPVSTGATSNSVAQALELIGTLRDQVGAYTAEMDRVKADLDDYGKRLQADHDALLTGKNSIQSLMSMEQHEIEKLEADIVDLQDQIGALNKQIMDSQIGLGISIFVGIIGLALAPVTGGATLTVAAVGVAGIATSAALWATAQQKVNGKKQEIQQDKTAEDALKLQIYSLGILHKSVAFALDQMEGAQTALSDLRVFWGVFEQTLLDVIKDLNKPNAQLSVVLDRMWVHAAKNNWKNLTGFAQALLGATVEVRHAVAA